MNGTPINAYQIKLTGTGLESPTIRYTGIGEPEGEVGFSPLGGYVCPASADSTYFITVYSEDATGNKQLSARETVEFKGCAGGKGQIVLRFRK